MCSTAALVLAFLLCPWISMVSYNILLAATVVPVAKFCFPTTLTCCIQAGLVAVNRSRFIGLLVRYNRNQNIFQNGDDDLLTYSKHVSPLCEILILQPSPAGGGELSGACFASSFHGSISDSTRNGKATPCIGHRNRFNIRSELRKICQNRQKYSRLMDLRCKNDPYPAWAKPPSLGRSSAAAGSYAHAKGHSLG